MMGFPSVRVENDIIVDTFLHTLILSNAPLSNNKYNKIHKIYIDANLEDISDNMLLLLSLSTRELYVSVNINEQIYGNSYEMALAMLLSGYAGSYATGTIQDIADGKIIFGKIKGLNEKKNKVNNLLHEGNLKSIKLSPY